MKESGVESLCGCKAAPIQCNPPDETDHCTITNTKNTEIQRQIHKYFSRSNAIRLMKQLIAQILTQNSDKNTRTNTKKPSQLAF